MNWTEKHIKGLLHQKKIRSYKISKKKKGYSKNGPNVPRRKSKALEWLEWNLLYWGNQNTLELEREVKFCSDRDWRFDFAFRAVKIAVEYEGGIYMERSGHNSHNGIQRDIDKYTRAQILGWTVIRVSAKNYTTVLKTLNEIVETNQAIKK